MRPGARERQVLVVEDHALFAEALVLALTTQGYDVARLPLGTSDTTRLLDAALRTRPAVVLLDLDLGRYGDGRTLIRPLSRAGSQVVVVTGSDDRALWGGCLQEGARTVVAKQRPLAELVEVIHRVHSRRPVISREEYQELTSLWHRRHAEDEECRRRLDALTPRERQVLGQLVSGRTVREIAEAWVVSEATVRTQVRSILGKLQVSTQIAAVGVARRVGWQPPGTPR